MERVARNSCLPGLMITLLILLSGCSVTPDSTMSVGRIDVAGVWYLMDYDEGTYSNSLIAFMPSGRKCVISTEYNSAGQPAVRYYDNEYEVEGRTITTRVLKSSSRWLPPGDSFKDDIIKLNTSEMDLLMQTSGSYTPHLEKHVRLPAENPLRVCNVVNNYFQSRGIMNSDT